MYGYIGTNNIYYLRNNNHPLFIRWWKGVDMAIKARIRYKDKELNKIIEAGEIIPTKDKARIKKLLDMNVATEVADAPEMVVEKTTKK